MEQKAFHMIVAVMLPMEQKAFHMIVAVMLQMTMPMEQKALYLDIKIKCVCEKLERLIVKTTKRHASVFFM